MSLYKVEINTARCIGCGMCASDCVAHNIKIKDSKAHTILDECTMCGHCTAICPREAVSIRGYASQPVSLEQTPRLDPDEIVEVIRFRRSIRKFQNKDIPPAVLRQILEAGRLTHTAENLQDVSFIVLNKKKEQMERIAVRLFRVMKPFANLFSPMARNNTIDDHFFFFHAPIVIVVAAKQPINGILAAQNMEFVAEANGLGLLFSGFFTTCANISPRLKKALRVPKGKKVAATLVLGYPQFSYRRSPQRKNLDVTYL